MLSILIPTYNYNVVPLVLELQKQCLECKITFEILVFDDCSKLFIYKNQKINSIENCRFEVLEKNIGRSAIRNLLAKKAEFNSLLFLDADTIPIHNHFIKSYVAQINDDEKVVYGGIEYQKDKPKKSRILRWKYGHSREALSVEKRNINPYISFLTLNFLIQKSIFSTVFFNETIPNLRHEDTLFSYNLMEQKIKIIHIENPVFHLGIDDFEVAIKKENESILGLKYLIDHQLLPTDYVRISKIAAKIEKLKLNFAFAFFYKTTRFIFLKNLSSKNPSLLIFDLYRLGNLCKLNSN
ncbi:glycosyltransferase family 2 protein [Flavobacterium franklandianum]|uniref:Glycosyltransferase family 2 protein n=1 Tax=Flavobacterium franklandianum TaxID=2594430 RepID=A0A553C7W8_9FLAO|nr:glycosyltransferase family 2 protein [Flavobacterium franklandianum]TRX16585.1 glycosyltransferase family 2 protein [Flavobacterium franklandianum]